MYNFGQFMLKIRAVLNAEPRKIGFTQATVELSSVLEKKLKLQFDSCERRKKLNTKARFRY
jgi:hypothetical protein